MTLKSIVSAVALVLAASGASATDFTNGATGQYWDFANGSYSWVVNVGALPGDLSSVIFESDAFLDIASVKLDGSSIGWSNFSFGPNESWLLGTTPVLAGAHTFTLTGSGDGRIFAGASFTAAVPEPETYAMMLAGLGAIGFMARRRQANK